MKKNLAPFIAVVLLLLPVLYVGSYLAMVSPKPLLNGPYDYAGFCHYRVGNNWAKRLFWPLEQIDRKVRPEAWDLERHGWTIAPPLSAP
jgi:hypothetical protein